MLKTWNIFPCRVARVFALVLGAALLATAAQSAAPSPAAGNAATDAAGTAALRATIVGTSPKDRAPMPDRVPLVEINLAMPWALPTPGLLWFARRFRVWFSEQPGPAPLAIVIAGAGADGSNPKMSILRGALYGAGYHVLTMPSPTFPGFIVSASTTGVAGDLAQDSRDLYAAMQQVIAHLPRRVRISAIDLVGYSLGGANAAVVKSADAAEGKLHIRRAVMINPPVSLYASMARLDGLFAEGIGSGTSGIEDLYRRLYARLANMYRATNRVEISESVLLGAAAIELKSDADMSAAIALIFRQGLGDMYFVGDLYARTGVVIDPDRPPRVGDSLEKIQGVLRGMSFADYFARVFVPYYRLHRPGSTAASLIADNRLAVIGDALRANADYYVQTNSDDMILDQSELQWLRETFGSRIVIYERGGHMGNLGDRTQVADMLDMLSGRWSDRPR